ncbi:hypothetical protein KP77_24470 [Jeotgalibacillus alimentarius]|uniref:Uncharacterized protein n=1 Tax=Jeotgalibacillus alimentarius TaxID=135826 RepID=A0A0C2RYK4_9BACL|nr:hypothetical protein [Jeotgalibacillus alimentarius]KIL46879.1 hypothetical protein KP77_24470 [Jeotgalibacillus alimentarius]
MLETEKSLNDFLFAAGLPLSVRAGIIREAMKKHAGKRVPLIIEKGESVPPLKTSDTFKHNEDEEVWFEVAQLDMRDRVYVLLPYFDETAAFDKEAFLKLKERMENRFGYRISDEQLGLLMKMMTDTVKEQPAEILPDAPSEMSEAAETGNRKPLNLNWPVMTVAGAAIIAVIFLLLQDPNSNDGAGETTFAPEQPDSKTLAEAQQAMTSAVEDAVNFLSEQTGLNREQLEELEYVENLITRMESVEELGATADTEETAGNAISSMRNVERLATNEMITPINKLASDAQQVSTRTSFAILQANDALLSRFTSNTFGMINVYEEVLLQYESELNGLETDIAQFQFSDEAQALIDKIEENGFEVTIQSEQQSFDVNYSEERIDRAIDGLLTDEYARMIREKKYFPYVTEDRETDYSYAQQSIKLLTSEDILIRMAGDEWLTKEMLIEHSRLFQAFLLDVTDESQRVRPEVLEIWEGLITEENIQKYSTARYIRDIYNALGDTDYIMTDEVREIRDKYTLVPVLYRIRYDDAYFPLSDNLQEKYNMLNSFQNISDISYLLPKEAVLIYMNAMSLNNPEVAEMMSVPGTFVIDDQINWSDQEFLAGRFTSIQTAFADGKALVTLSGGDYDEREIVLQEINGVWMVEFDADHLSWF